MPLVMMDLPGLGPVYSVEADDIMELQQRHPGLSRSGLRGTPGSDDLTTPESVAQVNHCIAFLSAFTHPKTPKVGSYSLKHMAERAGVGTTSYIPNGALIAAGLILGIPHTSRDGSPNMDFSISEDERRWVLNKGERRYKGMRMRKPPFWDDFLIYTQHQGESRQD